MLHSSGTGGVEALANALTDDMIAYCLVRETDSFDNSVTVKFVFIFWLGDHSNRMQKARTSTHMGYIKSFIGVRALNNANFASAPFLSLFIFAVISLPKFNECLQMLMI